jgi:hypothetical protein
MNARPKRLATLVCAGLVAAATPVLAAEVIYTAPATTYYYAAPATTIHTTPTSRLYNAPSTVESRTYYYVTEGPSYTYTPAPEPTVTEVIYEAPAITVEAPRLTEDQRITSDVVDVLANDPYLSGRIGVETRDRDVHLSGNVATPGQVRRAVRGAKGVWGVDNVTSELRPRVGANTSY